MTGTVAEQLARRAAAAGGAEAPASVAVVPVIQRIGLGLPLSHIFATYFGTAFGKLEAASVIPRADCGAMIF